jgi:hypothetical protein
LLRAASIEVAPQGPRYFNDWNRVVAFYEAALSTIVAIPGVRGAAVTNLVPFGEGRFDQAVAPADRPTEEWHAEYRFVSPGYFATMNVPLHSGRSFTSADGLGAARVAILGTSTAVRLFGGTDPVGRQSCCAAKHAASSWAPLPTRTCSAYAAIRHSRCTHRFLRPTMCSGRDCSL